jgi:hypothetical protein
VGGWERLGGSESQDAKEWTVAPSACAASTGGPSLTIEGYVSWEYRPAFDAGHRAALQSGKNLVFVCPPAAWAVVPLVRELPPPGIRRTALLVLVPDVTDALELAGEIPALPVTGLARAQRLLAAQTSSTLIATPADAMELVRRAALKTESLEHVVVCWPDRHDAAGHMDTLDLLLAESKGAARLVATTDPETDQSFIERHARRAALAIGGRLPDAPCPSVRYVVTAGDRVGWTVRAVLDALNPSSALLWDPTPDPTIRWQALAADLTVTPSAVVPDQPVELAVAARLPSADALVALHAAARNVVVLARPTQVTYLERLAHPLKVMRLASDADRARDAAYRLRAQLRERLAAGGAGGNLMALAPLFDEFDPALVAAAAVGSVASDVPDERSTDVPAWIVVRVNAGRRDRLRPADVVGTLINVVGLPKDHVGLVDIRDTFTLVYVLAEAAERARQGLDGVSIRGRQIAATLDRR